MKPMWKFEVGETVRILERKPAGLSKGSPERLAVVAERKLCDRPPTPAYRMEGSEVWYWPVDLEKETT